VLTIARGHAREGKGYIFCVTEKKSTSRELEEKEKKSGDGHQKKRTKRREKERMKFLSFQKEEGGFKTKQRMQEFRRRRKGRRGISRRSGEKEGVEWEKTSFRPLLRNLRREEAKPRKERGGGKAGDC